MDRKRRTEGTAPETADGRSGADTGRQTGPRALWVLLGLAAILVVGFLVGRGGLEGFSVPEVDQTSSLWLVFLTGLSVGGLSCLAVQGGLLAAMIAARETRLQTGDERGASRALPVAAFLTSKVVAYTALGAVLGLLGAKFPLSLQGWALIGAGVFMLIVVLQMFDAHPALRRVSFTPPKSVQRMLRRESKRADVLGPWALGALTVFIPCGVTIAMEMLAVTSEQPLRGAQIMLAFTLGTVPTFLVFGVAAAALGRSAYRVFRPLAAVTVSAVALISIVSGARLLGFGAGGAGGASVEATLIEAAPQTGTLGAGGELAEAGSSVPAEAAAPGAPDTGAPAAAPRMTAIQEATVQVVTGAYLPDRVLIQPNVPTRLKLVTNDTRGCIRAFVIPSMGVQVVLPATGSEVVEIPPAPAGSRIPFMCSMGMYTGVIEVATS